MSNQERVRDFFDAAYLQPFLENRAYELIYVDEFHVSMKSSTLYNWSLKGYLAIISVDPDTWIMSFVVALSRKRIEGILASNRSIDSSMFKWFMQDVVNLKNKERDNANKFWFIMDNSPIHCSIERKDFMKNSKVRWITIPPYSPQLNAAEKLIGLVKVKLLQKWVRNKPLSLKLAKSIIDEISEDSCQKWINSSREETFKKMKILNILG